MRAFVPELRALTSQLGYIGIGNKRILGNGNATGFVPAPDFSFNLRSGTIVPERGTVTPVFTRAASKYAQDYEGIWRSIPSGGTAFAGMRPVFNLIPTPSTTIAVAANKTVSVAIGTYIFSMGAEATATSVITFTGTATGSTGTLTANATNRTARTLTITVAGTIIATCTVTAAVDVQLENVTGQSNQNPSEYVPVGTGGPLFGANVLPNQNPNTWSAQANVSIGSGIADPFGGASAYSITATGVTGVCAQAVTFTAGFTTRAQMWIRRRSGTGAINIYNTGDGSGQTAITALITSTWQQIPIAPQLLATATNNFIGVQIFISGDAVDIYLAESNRCLFSGSNIDGLKHFPYLNGNTVASNVVTEVQGLPINSSTAKFGILDGVSGNHFSTPDSVANSITGDIDIDACVALVDWTPASANDLVTKYGGAANVRDYYFAVKNSTGVLRYVWTPTSLASVGVDSTVAPIVSDGTILYARVTHDIDNGAGGNTVTFYTSQTGVSGSWVQLGSPVVTAGVTDRINSSQQLEIGSDQLGTVGNANGKIYRARIYNGIRESGGTLAVDFNPNSYTSGATWASTTGETWTINGNASVFTGAGLWDADGPTGYNAEPAATNLFLRSRDFANAAWVKSAATVSATKVLGPFGTVTAEKLEETAVSSAHRVVQNLAKAASATLYTATCQLKQAERTWALILISNVAETAYVGRFFNLATGALGTAIQAGAYVATNPASIKQGANGFWECTVTATTDAAAETNGYVYAASADGTLSYLGVLGSGIIMEAFNFKAGASTTDSPIDTTTVSVARPADALSYTGLSVSGAVTIAATFTPRYGVSGTNGSAAALLADASNYHNLYYSTANNAAILETTGGVAQANFGLSGYVPTLNTTCNLAYTAQNNDVRAVANAGAIGSDVSGTAPTNLTTLRVGYGFVSGDAAVNVAVVDVYRQALTNAQLVRA